MSVRELDQTWTTVDAATTGGLKAVYTHGDLTEWAFYVQTATASTATIALQSAAVSSAGPWATICSTDLAANTAVRFSGEGPLLWVRPYITAKTTGICTMRLVGVS